MALTTRILFPMAVACALFAASYSPRAEATAVITVTNCNNTGPGSLRDAIATAATGSVIDIGHLPCWIIPLAGNIVVPQTDLKIIGSPNHRIIVDGNYWGRIFDHTGTGTFELRNVWLVRGLETAETGIGGCIRSRGNVTLRSTHMHECQARPNLRTDGYAYGGAIHAAGDVTLVNSLIHRSFANGRNSYGGGIVSSGTVRLYASRVSNTAAVEVGGILAREFYGRDSLVDHNGASEYGGVSTSGNAYLLRTSIADNIARGICGGLCVDGDARIVDSTIGRNSADEAAAAMFNGHAAIYNSTIATNVGRASGCGAAVVATAPLNLESTIAASNYCPDGTPIVDIAGTSAITGAHNLVRSANVALPADTIHLNPRLHTLADNGGPTPTMVLLEGSPAIDRGSNVLGLSYDQRGPGFPRVKGPLPDIGAVER